MKKIILFDMDGTLIDSGYDITTSINYVRQNLYDLEPLSINRVINAINAPNRNLASIFYGVEEYSVIAKEMFEEHYFHQCTQHVRAYDNINTVLEMFYQSGAIMGVATNAPSIFAHRMLQHVDLIKYFHTIHGADDVKKPKPDPQMLTMHLELYGYNSSTDRAWMIGDNSKDMEAASRAGISGIFAGWGFSSYGYGDHSAATPLELLDLIL